MHGCKFKATLWKLFYWDNQKYTSKIHHEAMKGTYRH